MLTLATLSFFAAIKSNPIPNALTLLFISPLVVAVLSPRMLGEKFDLFIGTGVVVGFIGVIVVLQPTGDEFNPSLLLAVVSGVCYALYIIFTKKLSFRAPPVLTLFYSASVGLLIMMPLALMSWTTPDMRGILLGSAMGFFAAASHFMIIKAFQFASASELSPFNYFEIVGAITLSYIVFGYVPNLQAIIGLLVIIASGLFVSWRVMKNNDGHSDDKEKLIEPLQHFYKIKFWPKANFCLMAGGGMNTGQVIGATNSRGEEPIERPIKFQEVFALSLIHI